MVCKNKSKKHPVGWKNVDSWIGRHLLVSRERKAPGESNPSEERRLQSAGTLGVLDRQALAFGWHKPNNATCYYSMYLGGLGLILIRWISERFRGKAR